MGNTAGRRSKNDDVVTEAAAPAASRRVVVTARKQRRDDDDEEEQTTRAGRRRPRAAGGVSPARGGGSGAARVGAVVTVKVVMTRKDAEALVARLKARARKARMAELKGELRARDCCGSGAGNGARPAPCRDAYWSPHLAPIKEK